MSGRDQGTPIPDHEGPLPGKVITGDAQEGVIEPGDRPRAADRWGTTAAEERAGAPLDERIRWEEPDLDASGRDVEADEFASLDEIPVDNVDIDSGVLDREHAAPLAVVEGPPEIAGESAPDDAAALGPAPDGLAAAVLADGAVSTALDGATDEELEARIDELVDAREEALRAADHDRSARLDVELDQLWDLLRQRRALRSAGQDPSLAHVRPAGVVEGYEQ